ncbi:MAG: hypothetical protein ABIJ12_02160 [bacterium]
MEALLEFARGPLFRLSLAIMILGLIRILALDLYGAWEAYRKAGDKTLPWKLITVRTLHWFFPVKRVLHSRPVYSIISILFHVGLLLVPLFLFAHIQLWKSAIGFGWWALPKGIADILTIITITCGILLFIGRVSSTASNFISRKQDYWWPLLLLLPFITGFLCMNSSLAASTYQLLILIHILAAELIFILLPFTKIAHCILMPLSQFIANLAWKFPANTDDDICTTLNKKGAPV